MTGIRGAPVFRVLEWDVGDHGEDDRVPQIGPSLPGRGGVPAI